MRNTKHAPAVRIDPPAQFTFDYDRHEIADKREELERCAGEIVAHAGAALAKMLDAGRALIKAQSILANPKDGVFCAWVEQRIGLKGTQAYRYMDACKAEKYFPVHRKVFSINSLAALGSRIEEQHGLDAIDGAKALASAGHRVTEKMAKELLLVARNKRVDPTTEDDVPYYIEQIKAGDKKKASGAAGRARTNLQLSGVVKARVKEEPEMAADEAVRELEKDFSRLYRRVKKDERDKIAPEFAELIFFVFAHGDLSEEGVDYLTSFLSERKGEEKGPR